MYQYFSRSIVLVPDNDHSGLVRICGASGATIWSLSLLLSLNALPPLSFVLFFFEFDEPSSSGFTVAPGETIELVLSSSIN